MSFSTETQTKIDAAFAGRDLAVGMRNQASTDRQAAEAGNATAATSSAAAAQAETDSQSLTSAALAAIAAELEAGLPASGAAGQLASGGRPQQRR